MAKYKVLAEVEVLGEVRALGSELEIDVETAAPLVAEGKLEEVKEDVPPTPPTPPANQTPSTDNQPPADAGTPLTPKEAEEKNQKEGWAGNHSV